MRDRDKHCYICPSDKHVDDHHLDCRKGQLSSETLPLCRRCHRTFHDLGVDWFEDEFLDKAIELENKRREIHYANIVSPVKPLELMTRQDVKRSAYFNKKHGIRAPGEKTSNRTMPVPFRLPNGEPLCGWDWIHQHLHDLDDWVPKIQIKHPALTLSVNVDSKDKLTQVAKTLKGLRETR